VGNAQQDILVLLSVSVHPHGRGERRAAIIGQVPLRGSSPRAWGTLLMAVAEDKDTRFIPTGVGNAWAIGF